jgi:hypothetical protein
MDKATLVGIDLEAGRDLLKLLDEAKFKVTAAAWVHLPEFSDWRLWIASPVYDSEGIFEALRRIQVVLRKASPRMPIELDQITVVSPKDPVIRDLRRRFGKADWFVEGTRIGGHMIGDRFVEDGYLYRVKR